MRNYDVQHIDIGVDFDKVFGFVADPEKLPLWTNAFAQVSGKQAVMRTPAGEMNIELEVVAEREPGTIDWIMRFADGSEETAYSRVVPLGPTNTVFSFVLMPSALPLVELEGALAEQSKVLAGELAALKEILESSERNAAVA